MASMSYCAFENTSTDMQQCIEMMQTALEEGKSLTEFIKRKSQYEQRAVGQLYELCEEFIAAYNDLASK